MFGTAATACRITLPAARLAIVGLATDDLAACNLAADDDVAAGSPAAVNLATVNATAVNAAIADLADSAESDRAVGDLDHLTRVAANAKAVLTARRNRNSLRLVRFQDESSRRRRQAGEPPG